MIGRELQIKNKTYTREPTLEILADKVIDDKQLGLNSIPVNIEYVLVYPFINKTTAGKCTKTSNVTRFLTDKHFVIELSGDLWDKIDDKTKEILMWHELNHVGAETDKNGEWIYKIVRHNIEDFIQIVKIHGVDWLENFRTIVASVYDLDPEEAAKVNF